MRWVVRSSLRFRVIVIAAAAAMMVFGATELQRDTRVDVFPEFAPPRVEVQTPTLGLSAAEVEEFVTVPLEHQLNGVPRLDVIRSSSVPQLSSVTLIFERGTNLIKARQLVQERMATITPSLPSWAMPPLIMPPLSSTSRIMKIGLSSSEHSLVEMSSITRHTIRQHLLRVPGVANVAIWGQRKEQRLVLVDPDRMRAHGVSMQRVMEATGEALDAPLLPHSPGALVGTGGGVDTPNQRLRVTHVLPIRRPKDLGAVKFTGKDGETV